MSNEYHSLYPIGNHPTAGAVALIEYRCVSCQDFERSFAMKFGEDGKWIMKIGQFPAWDISANHDIEIMLGVHKNLLKKGMICESQGYGIGAFGYYRRIVEELIDRLLTSVQDLLSEQERVVYSAALDNVRSTRVATEKIELVQDLLPPILRPSGMNSLSLLHGVLNEGLHAESDEKCLELAMEVREILVFLATQLAVAGQSARFFTDKMRSLLDKRDNRVRKPHAE